MGLLFKNEKEVLDQLKEAKDDLSRESVALIESLIEERENLLEVVSFYADPDTYFAIELLVDPPAGLFAKDFSDVTDLGYAYDREMLGANARTAITPYRERYQKENNDD